MKSKLFFLTITLSIFSIATTMANFVVCYQNNGVFCRYVQTSKQCSDFTWAANVFYCKYIAPLEIITDGNITDVTVYNDGSIYSLRNNYMTKLVNVKTLYPDKDMYVDATLNSTETTVTLTFTEVVWAGQGKGRLGKVNTMDIKIADETSVTFAPNPVASSSIVNITSDDLNAKTFEIYDLSGKLVTSINNIMSSEFVFEKGNIPAGLYIYKVSTGNRILTRGKFSIE